LKTVQATEHEEQVTLFQWIEYQPTIRDIAYAVPNGGLRHKAVAGKLKAEGVRSGIPDVVIPLRRAQYGALYIEMKVRKGGRVSDDQAFRMQALANAGNLCVVCNGADEAIDEIKEYLELK